MKEKNMDEVVYDEENPYEPSPHEIAGFDLCGWKQADGTILLGSSNDPNKATRVDKFPEVVYVCGVMYTLEDTEFQENGFGWGFYV
jgi:hypothetical protein